jgi:hypothetical protein
MVTTPTSPLLAHGSISFNVPLTWGRSAPRGLNAHSPATGELFSDPTALGSRRTQLLVQSSAVGCERLPQVRILPILQKKLKDLRFRRDQGHLIGFCDRCQVRSLEMELEFWCRKGGNPGDDEFVFPSQRRTPLNGHNYRRRNLAPLAKKLGIEGFTFQCLRGTFATPVPKARHCERRSSAAEAL